MVVSARECWEEYWKSVYPCEAKLRGYQELGVWIWMERGVALYNLFEYHVPMLDYLQSMN